MIRSTCLDVPQQASGSAPAKFLLGQEAGWCIEAAKSGIASGPERQKMGDEMKPYARANEGQGAGSEPAGRIGAAEDADAREVKPMSVIGADITISGNIEATVDLHIEGVVKGDVRCATLILGESSSVVGSIYADRVRVSGSVDGSIDTKDLAVEATARVVGDVLYARLRVANGGVIDGTMKSKPVEDGAAEASRLKLVEPKVKAQAGTAAID